jgi:hypothetical protein
VQGCKKLGKLWESVKGFRLWLRMRFLSAALTLAYRDLNHLSGFYMIPGCCEMAPTSFTIVFIPYLFECD